MHRSQNLTIINQICRLVARLLMMVILQLALKRSPSFF